MTPQDPVDAIHRYIDAFNAADLEAMTACFAPSGVILDGLAPHLWQGPEAPRDWYKDVVTAAAHEGASDYFVSVDEPQHSNVTGDAAYVVAPATMRFKLHGQPVVQTGATFTVGLTRKAGAWRIAAWAWAKGQASRQET